MRMGLALILDFKNGGRKLKLGGGFMKWGLGVVAAVLLLATVCAGQPVQKAAYVDYAPAGMPDFDQKQDNWGLPTGPGGWQWTYCGPVALLNCIWWFDSRFEVDNIPPPTIHSTFDLIPLPLTFIDDHDPQNVMPMVQSLAWYVNTDGQRTGASIKGTLVTDMAKGIRDYLNDQGMGPENNDGCWFEVVLQADPSFEWIYEEMVLCNDVILLIGFWTQMPDGTWMRIGGHYVTVAGADTIINQPGMICISDPFIDVANPIPSDHNDAANVSHDWYQVGTWYGLGIPELIIEGYPIAEDPSLLENFIGQNPSHWPMEETYPTEMVIAKVEYAIKIYPMGEYCSIDLVGYGWNLISSCCKAPAMWKRDIYVDDGTTVVDFVTAGALGWLQPQAFYYVPGEGYKTAPGDDDWFRCQLGYWLLTLRSDVDKLRLLIMSPACCCGCCFKEGEPYPPEMPSE